MTESKPRVIRATLTTLVDLRAQCVSAPGSHVSLIQLDAYKKLLLVQLVAFGKVRRLVPVPTAPRRGVRVGADLQLPGSGSADARHPLAGAAAPQVHDERVRPGGKGAVRAVRRVCDGVCDARRRARRAREREGQGGVREGASVARRSSLSGPAAVLCGAACSYAPRAVADARTPCARRTTTPASSTSSSARCAAARSSTSPRRT